MITLGLLLVCFDFLEKYARKTSSPKRRSGDFYQDILVLVHIGYSLLDINEILMKQTK